MANNEFSRGLTEKRHLYNSIHRRTHSNNIETVKGVISLQGHRRTLSNTAQEFNVISYPQPIQTGFRRSQYEVPSKEPLTPDSLNSPASSTSSQHKKKNKKGFIGLLDAAITYFNHEPQFQIQAHNNETTEMKREIRRLNEKQSELENAREVLLNDYEMMKQAFEDQRSKRESYEKHIQSLQSYTQELEMAVKKIQTELRNEQKRNEQLKHGMASNENQDRRIDEDNKRRKEESLRVDKPSPTPIMYKPISQRGMKEEKRRSMGFT